MTRFPFRPLRLCLGVCLLPAIAHADPYGGPFQVDTFTSANLSTTSTPSAFSLATGAGGDSILLWQSGPDPGTSYIQRYDAAGRALQTQEWPMGTGATAVAMASSGNFAILRRASDGSDNGVFVTIYSRAGNVVVPQFRVNNTTAGRQEPYAIGFGANGQFVVAWASSASPPVSLYAKSFLANGVAASGEILLQQTRTSSEFIGGAEVAVDAAGNFVVTWNFGDINTTTWNDVWAKRFSPYGVALTTTLRVNTYTPNGQDMARVAMNDAGAFVIAWSSPAPEGGYGVYVQRYAANGAALGGEQRINVGPSSSSEGLDVSISQDGGFVVTWHDDYLGLPQIFTRAYSNAGVALSAPIQVSAAVNVWPTSATIGMDRAGNFLIAWLQHHYTNDVTNAVFARRYSPAGVPIQALANGQPVSNLAGAAGSWRYFKISVPPGRSTLDASIFGGFGDADLYLRWGALPTLDAWDGRPYLDGSNEGARMLNYPAGDWYIGINGYTAYGGLGVQATSY